jgi:nucleoside-diphosphate-sugar epimerase
MGYSAEFDRLYDSLQVNIEKNKKILGWTPEMSVESGLSQVVKGI